MTNSPVSYYYAHDQLYSPVVLVNSSGSIEDRYEYDAYGACRVLNADYSADADSQPDCGNPYLFTGREVDYLDNGSLALQYNRHRYYSQSLGRWTSEDPLGTNPAGDRNANAFTIRNQYQDGVNLYEYVRGRPIAHLDPLGMDVYLKTGNNTWNPLNNAIHQSVCVDAWDRRHCKKIGVVCFSFGADRRMTFMTPFRGKWLGWDVSWWETGPSIRMTLRGIIYRTRRNKGARYLYFRCHATVTCHPSCQPPAN